MSYTMYTPLNVWLDPASVTDVVAYIQNYLSENTIYSEEEIEELIHDYLIAHPELIGGVQSVNGKTGAVVLSASDINTANNVTIESVLSSLSSQISSIAASVATNTSNITSLTGRVTTAETEISNLKSALESSSYQVNDISKQEKSKNIFNPVHVVEGRYYNNSGGMSANSNYVCCEDYWEVESDTIYSIAQYNPDRSFAGAVYCFICFYDSNKTFISWIENGSATITTPQNAKYLRFSANKSYFNGTKLVQIEKGSSYTIYEPPFNYVIKIQGSARYEVLDIVETNGLQTITVTVDASGNGDYTSLRDAVEFVRNYQASIIYITPGTYDIASYYTQSEMSAPGFVGLRMPINCQLIGTGDRDATIITMTLPTKNQLISTLNIQSNFTMKNVTVSGTRTRYAVHDDLGYAFVNDKRLIENCLILGTDLYYANAYGSGNTRNGAHWTFKDCVFKGDACPFSNHNGTGIITANNIIEFINCRFINTNSVDNTGYVLMLRSLSNAMGNHWTLVNLYGCKGNGKIILGEENASVYGAGLRFRVTGYSDDFGEVVLSHTDSADYSDIIDII